MKVIAIIQARLGSTRLPGKVLKDIGGETMLARVIRRSQSASLLDEVIVATTIQPDDKEIVSECEKLGVQVFRGSELDVLDRYYQTAMYYKADVIVRITSDCPLIDGEVVDKIITVFNEKKADYAGNGLERTYPRGLGAEVMTIAALERTRKEASKDYERVHVTPYMYENPQIFKLASVTNEINYSYYRWTVDTQEDLDFVRAVYVNLGNRGDFSWCEVLELLEKNPELAEINKDIHQKNIEEC
ncbi:MAG: glycosyltransferase family protein [Planctomycetota bacterium]